MKNILWLLLFLIFFYFFFGGDDKENIKEKENIKIENNSKKNNTNSSSEEWYDENKYAICYGQMTKAHKKRGFHDSNRAQSIKVKETVCKAFAKGDINDYEGKQ